MTTNQTPEAGSVAKLAEARVLQSWCEARLGDSEWGHFMQQHFQRIAKCIGDLAALAEQGQRDSERLRTALHPFADGNWTKELAAKAYAAIEATKD
jgi:hypothetical protein